MDGSAVIDGSIVWLSVEELFAEFASGVAADVTRDVAVRWCLPDQ
jgi:hypothetical protein